MKKVNTYTDFEFLVRLIDLADSKEQFEFLRRTVVRITPFSFSPLFLSLERGYN